MLRFALFLIAFSALSLLSLPLSATADPAVLNKYADPAASSSSEPTRNSLVAEPARNNAVAEAASGSVAEPATSGQFNVTPVGDCYAKLERHEAFDIRRNFENPYQECLRRVAENEKKEKAEKSKINKLPAPEPDQKPAPSPIED